MALGSGYGRRLCIGIVLAAACATGGLVVRAQGAAGPLGVADATARKFIVDAIGNDAFKTYQASTVRSDFVQTVSRALDRLPAAARGPATTAAFAWARAYTSTPAFAAEYAKTRAAKQPADAAPASSVDDALKKRMDEMLARITEGRKMAAAMPEKDRAGLLASLAEQEARMKSPEMMNRMREIVKAELGETTSRTDAAAGEFAAKYPATPNAFVKLHLQRFLTETASIDYSLAAVMVKGPSGETLGFLSPGYTGMPWQHVYAIVAGKEAVDAARSAAAAWLKELP